MQSRISVATVGKAAVLLVLLATAIALGVSSTAQHRVAGVARDLAAAGDHHVGAMVVFTLLYAASIGLGVPGTLLTLVGGAAFGMWRGLGLNLAGALLGCAIAFYEGKLLGAGFARRLLGTRQLAWLGGLSDWRRAFVTITRLRLMPILPFSAVNFSAGLTRTPFSAYCAGTAVGILPSTFLFTLFARELSVASANARHAASLYLAISLLGLCLLSFAPEIIARARRRDPAS